MHCGYSLVMLKLGIFIYTEPRTCILMIILLEMLAAIDVHTIHDRKGDKIIHTNLKTITHCQNQWASSIRDETPQS